MTEPTEEQVQEALIRAEDPQLFQTTSMEWNKDIDALEVLAQSFRRERAQAVVMREALEAAHTCCVEVEFADSCIACGLVEKALCYDAGKDHLELDSLKEKVIQAARLLVDFRTSPISKGEEVFKNLNRALSALEAKEKESV